MAFGLMNHLVAATEPNRFLDGHIWAELDERDVRVAYCSHWQCDGLLARSRRHHDECVVGIFREGKLVTIDTTLLAYTKSIDAALTLNKHNLWFCVYGPNSVENNMWSGGEKRFQAIFSDGNRNRGEGVGATPAIALCIAAIESW